MVAIISDIKRFAVHDGDGIRTTVFFKGCPLRCRWCHNPEGMRETPQLSYNEAKCISCGVCARRCPNGAQVFDESGHHFQRDLCKNCGKCVSQCLGQALRLYGKYVTAEDLLPLLLEDRVFYENSGGGVTLSGGEPLMQADFCCELLKRLKQEGINTAIDTCGFVNQEKIAQVLPYTDKFLYDIKAFDSTVHQFCTGQSNKCILENLRYIDSCGKAVEIRIPYVPTMNDGEIEKIGIFLKDLSCIQSVKVLPYHHYAASKYKTLGMDNTLPDVGMPSEEVIKGAVDILRGFGINAHSGNE